MATSHFEAALGGLGETGPLGVQSRMHADLGLAAHGLGDDDGARLNAARALELGEVAIDSAAVAQAHNILGVLARNQADMQAAVEHLGLSLSMETGGVLAAPASGVRQAPVHKPDLAVPSLTRSQPPCPHSYRRNHAVMRLH